MTLLNSDREVRKALHASVLRKHRRDGDTLVLNELGIRHGTCRVDIAVVNGYLHGYEIKSDADTLERLPAQMAIYSEVFDKMTLVVGEKHADKSISQLPAWWGVKVAMCGSDGIEFRHHRNVTNNPSVNPVALAELLWRSEAVEILRALSVPAVVLRKPRAALYEYLAQAVEINELRRLVRLTLKSRAGWRGQRPLSSDAD